MIHLVRRMYFMTLQATNTITKLLTKGDYMKNYKENSELFVWEKDVLVSKSDLKVAVYVWMILGLMVFLAH